MDKQDLRKFGVTMGVALLVITLIIFIRRQYIAIPLAWISALFFILAFIAPSVLKPVYIAWMKLALVLGWINTRIILAVMFYLVLTPIALFLRLLRKDLLDRKLEKKRESYWHKKEAGAFNPLQYERQF